MRIFIPYAVAPMALLAACGSIEPVEDVPVAAQPNAAAAVVETLNELAPANAMASAAGTAPPELEPMTAADFESGNLTGDGCRFVAAGDRVLLAATADRAAVKATGSLMPFDIPAGDYRAIEAGPTLTSDSLIVTVSLGGGAATATGEQPSPGNALLEVEAAGGSARTYEGQWRCAAA
jgi:hypothetical protein